MKVLTTETRVLFEAAVVEAVKFLGAGEVVVLPTETVYGLAANALDAAVVRKIFETKGRPACNPLIVHVASIEMARECVAEWPARAEELAKRFWPGPLTLVLPKSAKIPNEVTAGGATVAVRWPSHPFMQAVIRRCGFPLAAPSANRSNQLSPTNAQHVISGLGKRVKLIVDGGQCQVGIESTVFDVMANKVLRPGMISALELEDGRRDREGKKESQNKQGTLKSPGMLEKHYSPRARLIMTQWKNGEEAANLAKAAGGKLETTRVIAYEKIPVDAGFAAVAVIPEDAEAYARALYAELHRCDESGAEMILVETPPEGTEWDGIRDRLKRAAAS